MSRSSAYSAGLLLAVVVAGHLSLFPKVADLDGFYHIGHAASYLERSLFDTSLPWATQSIIADRGADLWWGFHVLLLPFGAADDPLVGIRLAAFSLTLLFAGGFVWVLRRHAVPGAGWWAVLLLIAVPNLFFRFLMVRPHMLSLVSALALLSLLVRGRWWQAALVSALITWLHLSLFWIAPGIVIAFTMVRLGEDMLLGAEERKSVPITAAVPAVFLGTVAGWLLRPNPIDTGALVNVQIIRLFAQKATEEPLLFAAELLPLPLTGLALTSWLFLALWIAAAIAVVYFTVSGRIAHAPTEERTLLIAAVLISVPFFLLAILSARRAMMQWAAFGFLTFPLLWTHVLGEARKKSLKPLLTVALVIHVGWGAWRHSLNVEHVAFRADTMAGAATFLKENSEPGEVAFHARWDNFGPLFAHNRTNLYLGGMDPIFQFAREPRLYWEFFYLSADINVASTCDAFPCANGLVTETHEVLADHFAARWVVVEPRRNPRFALFLLNDPRFRLAYDGPRESVFEVLSAP